MNLSGRLVKNNKNTNVRADELGIYENLYENLARSLPPDQAVGGGDFEELGSILMDTVIHAGMNQETNFFDFGCGTGRLAAQAVPFLNSDKYAGSDISKTMLSQADSLVKGFGKNARFFHQVTYKFPEQKLPIDMFSAFSVFTHMEHEDTYRYLCEAHRIASRNAIFVASILPISTALGESVFLSDSSVDFKDRWKNVRNVSTSLDFFQKIAELSGWKILEILNGDENSIPSRFGGESSCLGQTVVVMQR